MPRHRLHVTSRCLPRIPGEQAGCEDSMTAPKIINPRTWNGKRLSGEWLVSLKVDGIRAIWHDDVGWLSRANKPLYHLPSWQSGRPRDCEIFVNNFRDTIRA